MNEIGALLRELRASHLCITTQNDCNLCGVSDPVMCRQYQRIIKKAADLLQEYIKVGLSPAEVAELKFRMEGLEK